MKTSIYSRFILPSLVVSLTFGAWLFAGSLAVAADVETQKGHEGHSVMNHAAMGMIDNSQEPWAQKLKGQTIVENAIEGRPNRAAMVEMQHNRLMEQMARQAQDSQGSNTGLFNGMSTMHQYDGQGYLLASQSAAEPVATSGGHCPSTAPVKKYEQLHEQQRREYGHDVAQRSRESSNAG